MPKTKSLHRLRTLSIGGATYDVFLSLPSSLSDGTDIRLPGGKKVCVEGVMETCGGGACNTAVGLARLGCDAHFSGVIGADQWGETLQKTLKKEGVGVESVTVVEHETSSFSLIARLPSGERTILYYPGVSAHLHDATFDVQSMTTMDAVYLNHLCESACVIEDDIARSLLAHPAMHLTWNPGGCQIRAGMHAKETPGLLRQTNLLLLNKEEALEFSEENSIEKAAGTLLKAGVETVMITDGKHGTLGASEKGMYQCSNDKNVVVVDTTGAGDAFGCGATWAKLQGLPLPLQLIAGTLNATSVIGHIGAQAGLLTKQQMESAIATTTLDVQKV